MKSLLTFIAGVVVGVTIALYIEVLSKPALPTEADDYPDEYDGLGLENVTKAIYSLGQYKPLENAQIVKTLSENIELKWALVEVVTECERLKKTIADTQPVKVDDEVGAHDLAQWAKESE